MSKSKLYIIIGTSALLVFFTVYMLFFNKRNETVLNAMPNDVMCFFDINNANDFSIALNQNEIYQALHSTSVIGALHSDFNLYAAALSTQPQLLSDLLNSKVIAGAFTSGNTNIDYLLLLQLDEAAKFNLKNFKPVIHQIQPEITTHTFERATIYELTYQGTDSAFSCASENGIFIFSSSSVLVENAILQLKKGKPVTSDAAFKEVYANMHSNNGKGYQLYLNMQQMADYFSMFSTNEKYNTIMRLKNYVSWIGLEPELQNNGVALNGYASAKRENTTLELGRFTGQFATDLPLAVPDNTAILYRMHTSAFTENFAAKINDEQLNREFFDYWSPWMAESLIVGLSESLDGNVGKRAFIIIPATDIQLAQNKLKYALATDTLAYKGTRISTYNVDVMAEKLSGIQLPETCFGFWHDNALILAFDYLQITNMIDAATGNRNLKNNSNYTNFKQELSASFNTSVYLNLSKSEKLISGFVAEKYAEQVDKELQLLQQFAQLEIQFTQNKNIYLVNGFVQFDNNPQRSTGALWKLNLDTPVLSGPYCVMNDVAKQYTVLVQDTANQLIQISLNGDIQWKTKLDSKILGDIHEVDFYNNNKTQYVFSTQNGIYLIDGNGEPVEGFPITLTTKIINPISIIDEASDNYKMFVACENGNVYGYYKDGKPIGGWSPLKGAGKVASPVFILNNTSTRLVGFVNEKGIQLKKENGNGFQSIPIKSEFLDMSMLTNKVGILDNSGNLIMLDSTLQTRNFSGAITGSKPLVLDIQHDDTLDIIYFEDTYFKAKSITGRSIFVTEAALAVDATVKCRDGATTYFGYATLDNRLFFFDTEGKHLSGFPVEGSVKSTVRTISSNGDKMLITIVGNTVLAYRIL